jgi:phosphatidylcholine synthase
MQTRTILGWCVHAYTASGLVLGAIATWLLLQPNRTLDTYRYCFLLMFAAVIVDSTDGTMARAVKIREAVPSFNGRRLDDLVDFLLYTCIPLLLIFQAGWISVANSWVLIVALVASAYGFCQENIKLDGCFVGFPSYWNVLAYYVGVWDLPDWSVVSLILCFSVLTFVPVRYAYPSQPGKLNRLLLILGIPWGLALLWDLVKPWEIRQRPLAWYSFAYPALYLFIAWWLAIARVLQPKPEAPAAPSS